jgi:acyl dehydratase
VTDFSELVGTELGVGDWFEITQDRVDAFADATDDHQWIHQAGDRADNGPFGGPIAHGFLTLSLLTPLTWGIFEGFTKDAAMVINYGLDKVRYVTPVPVGSRIRARVVLADAKPVANGTQLTSEVTIELEGAERPAVVIEHLMRVY